MLSMVGHAFAINPDARLRAHARANGWRVYDYRTGRKAARAGLVAGTVAGGVTGAVAAAVALRGAATAGLVGWATSPQKRFPTAASGHTLVG